MPIKPHYYFLVSLLLSLFSFSSTAQVNHVIDSLTQELEETSGAIEKVSINYQLGKNYFRANNLSQAAKYAELSYDGAKKIGLDSTVANAAKMWGIISIYQRDTDGAIRLLKESNHVYLNLKDSAGLTSTYSLLSNVYNQYLNNPSKAFLYIDSAERYYREKDIDKIVFGKIVKGTIFTNVSEYQYALDEYYSALDLAEGDTSKMVSLHINLGTVFYAMGNKESALEYYRSGLKLAPKGERQQASLYYNISTYYHDKNKEDSAMLFLNRARLIFENNQEIKELFFAKIKTCDYLLEFGKKDAAQEQFSTIDTTGLSIKEKLMWWRLSYNLGAPLIDLSEFSRKFYLVKDILDDDSYLKLSDFFFEQFAKTGKVKRALEFKILYSDRKDLIVESEKVALGHAVKIKRIVLAKNKEITDSRILNDRLKYSVQIEEERNTKWRYTTVLSIILSLILIYSIYILYKRKSDKLKFNKKELAHEKMRKEILLNKLKVAKESMNIKNLEIETLLSDPARNQIYSNSSDAMMTNLKDRNWSIFLSDFELIYPVFFDTITNSISVPLSKNERRLCALIKLNLSNKEMSEYVFVSQESIKKAKNRLFKKFGKQGSGQEISDLIRNI